MLKFSAQPIFLFSLFLLAGLLCLGCRKDVEAVRQYPVTLSDLAVFLNQVPNPETTTTFQLNGLSEDKILITADGIRIFLTDVDQLFYNASSPFSVVPCSTCSDLKFVVTVANTKGDMLARALPTFSVDDMLLESGGMVQLQVYCGNTALQLLPGRTIKIQLPSEDAKENMFVYTAIKDDQGFGGWKNTGQEVFKADWPASGGSGTEKGYELVLSQLGWSNCAKVLLPVEGTPFCINLDPSYTGQNTLAYLVFENVMVVAPLKFDDSTHSFCFPNVPAGYPVRIVSVAKLDAGYWLGAAATETGTNSLLPIQPQLQDATQVLGYLRGL